MKKSIALVICFILFFSIAVCPYALEGEPDYTNFQYSQTHIDKAKNSTYIQNYLEGKAVPLDGISDVRNMCIPGLTKAENMIPQGMTYWPAKNRVLVSAYDRAKEGYSVVYALDFDSGKYVAEYRLNIVNHVGGIAVSGEYLYIATGKSISYVSLSLIEEKEAELGGAFDIEIEGKKSLSTNKFLGKNASVSYLSCSEGVLWAGNFFYNKKPDDYQPISEDINSRLVGIELSSLEEFKKCSSPTYTINIEKDDPDEVNAIQGATYADGILYLGCSYGTRADSQLYVGRLTLTPNSVITVSSSDFVEYKNLPMSEGLFVKDGSLYCLYESAANKYIGMNSKDPTDVVWMLPTEDLDPLVSVSVNTMPMVDIYNVGESFTQRGLTLTARYLDGSAKTVSNGFTCAGFSSKTTGQKTVTVTYEDKSTEFDVTVTNEKIPGRIYSISAEDLTVNYKQSKDIKINIDAGPGEYIGRYSSTDMNIVSVNESGAACTATGLKKGSTTVIVNFTDKYGNDFRDSCIVKVKYSFWQWLIIIFLFGWLWY